MQSDPVRRLPSGSIDYEFYHRRAAFIRANTIAAVFNNRRQVFLLLAAASFALALTWLSRAPVDSMDGNDREATRARFVCSSHPTASACVSHDEGHHAAC
jgi:hypothetical protein